MRYPTIFTRVNLTPGFLIYHGCGKTRTKRSTSLLRDFQGSVAYSTDKREGRDLQNALQEPYTLAPDCF